MKSAGKARNNGLYRHIRTSKEIIRNLLNDSYKYYKRLRRFHVITLIDEIMFSTLFCHGYISNSEAILSHILNQIKFALFFQCLIIQ